VVYTLIKYFKCLFHSAVKEREEISENKCTVNQIIMFYQVLQPEK